MKIKVGTTELNVINCYPYRFPNGKLVLKIEVSQSEIGHDDLRAFLKANKEDIILIKEDDTTETFAGFYYQVRIADSELPDGTEIHDCEIECVSENEYQIGILQRTVAEQAKVIEAQNQVIANQNMVNNALQEEILTTQMAMCDLYESMTATEETLESEVE